MTTTNPDLVELLPCPFCGGDAELQGNGQHWFVQCLDVEECGAFGRRSFIDDFAVECWNNRATNRTAVARIEELEQALRWRPISTYEDDFGTVLFGHWYEDDCNGYHGESRWLWIASGCRDVDWWFCDFPDDEFKPVYFHTVTHWQPLPQPPSSALGAS